MARGFEVLEHPADVGIEAYGASLAEAFEEAAQGLVSFLFDPSRVNGCEQRRICLQSADYEQLLVKWLGEILYLFDGQQFLCCQFRIRELSAVRLLAEVSGAPYEAGEHRTRMDVKAITYHQLQVVEGPALCRIRVFLDI
jgi:SHS2 domain-containing protein